MNRPCIDLKVIHSGNFINMRSEAQLLYFFLAVAADENGLSDVTVACNLTGTDYVEVKVLIENEYIELYPDNISLVKVNGIVFK